MCGISGMVGHVDPRTVLGSGSTVGSGLRGMRDRLELFGGRLDLASTPGQGTVLSAAVPLTDAGDAEEAP